MNLNPGSPQAVKLYAIRLYVLEILFSRYSHRLPLYHFHFRFFHPTCRMNNASSYFYVPSSSYVFTLSPVFISSFLSFFSFCFVLCFFFFQSELLIFTLVSLSQSTTMTVEGLWIFNFL